jgi:hypothetical protein
MVNYRTKMADKNMTERNKETEPNSKIAEQIYNVIAYWNKIAYRIQESAQEQDGGPRGTYPWNTRRAPQLTSWSIRSTCRNLYSNY